MKQLELNNSELNFLQVLGINYINGEFINTNNNNSKFSLNSISGSEDKNESLDIYTLANNNTDIEIRKYSSPDGEASSICIKKNQYKYAIIRHYIWPIFIAIEDLKCKFEPICYIAISKEKDQPFIKTDIEENFLNISKIMCSKDKIYTCATVHGDIIINLGYEYDYSKENYTKILKEKIDDFKNEEAKHFFNNMLPSITDAYESISKSIAKCKIKKI